MKRYLETWIVGLVMALFAVGSVQAQAPYPDKPIRLIVPYAPGGSTDVLARRFGEKLSASLGQPVIIENKTGAGYMIGAAYVATSPADGYTLFLGFSSLGLPPVLYKKALYKLDDFVAVSTIARAPFVLSVSPEMPASLPELIKYGKAHPGALAYGTQAIGGTTHLLTKLFEQEVGITGVAVPYRGTSLVWSDLISGRVNFYFDAISTSLSMYRSGKIRVLAVTGDQRSPAAPEIPTFKELGYPKLVVDTVWGVFAPAKTPKAIVERLSKAIQEAAEADDLRAKLVVDGTIAEGSTSAEFSAIVQRDSNLWVEIIKPMNLHLD